MRISPDSVLYEYHLKRLRHPVSPFISLKISSFLESKHLGNQAARKLADTLVIDLGGLVEAFALGQDAVLATG